MTVEEGSPKAAWLRLFSGNVRCQVYEHRCSLETPTIFDGPDPESTRFGRCNGLSTSYKSSDDITNVWREAEAGDDLSNQLRINIGNLSLTHL